MSEIDERKAEMRKRYGRIRRSLSPDERQPIDARITQRLLALDAYADARLMLAYLSFGSEVDTRSLIAQAWADGKTVALPRCLTATHEMEWYVVASFDGLEHSPLGMDEPPRDEDKRLGRDDLAGSLAVVPGLSFDAACNRLGYGGGYYDRFLAGYQGLTVGLCREGQMSESLRVEGVIDEFDRAVDVVITEQRVYQLGQRG